VLKKQVERIEMDRPNQPYARGQVAVMLFEVPPAAFLPLGDAMTVLINKPQFVMQYLQFPGGMLKPGETFADAARREPQEETGVIASSDPNDLIELCRVPKRRFGPDTGSFDCAFFGSFRCDFSGRFNPQLGQTGTDDEESQLVRFRDILHPQYSWRLANCPLFKVTLFPSNWTLLTTAVRNWRLATKS
jgi:8-oxo-dGTP pyrophosphatase MutT (NUDIX family)